MTTIKIPFSNARHAARREQSKPRPGILLFLAALVILSGSVLAQDDDSDLESRLAALEDIIRQQHADMEDQRARMERTIRQQQQDLDAQRRQLSAQYELIRQLQSDRSAEETVAQTDPDPLP